MAGRGKNGGRKRQEGWKEELGKLNERGRKSGRRVRKRGRKGPEEARRGRKGQEEAGRLPEATAP